MNLVRIRCRPQACLVVAMMLAPLCAAAADDDDALQKKLANPVSDLVTLPMQFTTTLHTGPNELPQHTLNIQPVYPTQLGGGWSLIHRLIVPVLSDPAVAPGQDRKNGLGDIVYEGFFSPAASGGLIWGAGPILQMRTATTAWAPANGRSAPRWWCCSRKAAGRWARW
jgi:hypothetical protein